MNSQRGILSVVTPLKANVMDRPEKRPSRISILITFGEADLEGTSQRHDDALVVTSWIGGFQVKWVMVDQGSGTKIIHPDLFKGLGLKLEDLSRYDTPLVGFDGRIVMLEGQIKLLVVTEGKEVEVNSIVVNTYSPYTMILRHP